MEVTKGPLCVPSYTEFMYIRNPPGAVAVVREASAPFDGHKTGIGRSFLLLGCPQLNVVQRGP